MAKPAPAMPSARTSDTAQGASTLAQPVHPLAARLEALLAAPDAATLGQLAGALQSIQRELKCAPDAQALADSDGDLLAPDALHDLSAMLAVVAPPLPGRR